MAADWGGKGGDGRGDGVCGERPHFLDQGVGVEEKHAVGLDPTAHRLFGQRGASGEQGTERFREARDFCRGEAEIMTGEKWARGVEPVRAGITEQSPSIKSNLPNG